MTRNYGCGLKKSFKYFNESIENILKESNDIEINEINVTFVKFYKYISENNSITKESINQIVNFFEKDKGIIFEDLAKTNYKYFKFKKKRIDSSVNGKRYTRVLQKLTNDEDNKKYKISIVANYIQSQDAALVR
jgi:undecaprenyl pyrophosphate synthase